MDIWCLQGMHFFGYSNRIEAASRQERRWREDIIAALGG